MKVTWEHAARRGKPVIGSPREGGLPITEAVVNVIGLKIETGMDLSKWFNGILFVGDKGMLLADYG